MQDLLTTVFKLSANVSSGKSTKSNRNQNFALKAVSIQSDNKATVFFYEKTEMYILVKLIFLDFRGNLDAPALGQSLTNMFVLKNKQHVFVKPILSDVLNWP